MEILDNFLILDFSFRAVLGSNKLKLKDTEIFHVFCLLRLFLLHCITFASLLKIT